jgi:ferredoxin
LLFHSAGDDRGNEVRDKKTRRRVMKVKVDKEMCSGDEICVDICPEVFKMEDDVAVTLMDTVPEDLQTKCREAAEECPSEAIIIED